MEREPISQAWMLELMEQMETRVTDAHGRVRMSINEMKVDMKSGFDRVTVKQEENSKRMSRHSERLLVIETAREVEAKQMSEDKQRISSRNTIAASLISTVITIGLFFVKWIILGHL